MMNGPIVIVSKYHRLGEGFSKKEIAKSFEHPGRRTNPHGYQSPASWISDLVALKKLIILCSICRQHFNPRKNGYRRAYIPDSSGKTSGFEVNGKCAGCKQETADVGGGTGFTPEETYNLLYVDPVQARRDARATWKAQSVWSVIQRARQSKGERK